MGNWNLKEVRKRSVVWWAFALTEKGKRYIVTPNDGWQPTESPEFAYSSIRAAKAAWAEQVRQRKAFRRHTQDGVF